jgi:hypothetical protein
MVKHRQKPACTQAKAFDEVRFKDNTAIKRSDETAALGTVATAPAKHAYIVA